MNETKDKPNYSLPADAGSLIDYLRSAITDGAAGLFDTPSLLRQIIEENIWRERFVSQTREIIRFDSFDDFISAPPPGGLGVSRKLVYKLCSGDISTLDLLDRTLKTTGRGGDRRSPNFKSNNVTTGFEQQSRGNSAIYSLRRLRETRPDLHARVLSKEISINQAMITAGFRRKVLNISLTADLEKNAELIKQFFSVDDVATLRKLLKHPVQTEVLLKSKRNYQQGDKNDNRQQ